MSPEPKATPLSERFVHQGEVGLVEVAQAPVDELGGLAGGSLRPVAGFNDAGAQPSGRGVQGDPGPGDPTADDE